MERSDELLLHLRTRLLNEIDWEQAKEDALIEEKIEALLLSDPEVRQMSVQNRGWLKKDLLNSLKNYDVISELLADDSITEVMVNNYEHIFVETGGKLLRFARTFRNEEALQELINRIVSSVNREVNRLNPIADARLLDGSRVHVVLAPVALDGPVLTIRKFSKKELTMDALIHMGSISEEAAAYLKRLVIARYNIFISGGTGAGKTTLLNALANAYIPKDNRIITIEDSAELKISLKNLVRLEAKAATSKSEQVITIRDLIRASLRMRPDRIIVGEIRGSEIVDMLQAMNTGHDGSLSTGHANSAKAMLTRLEVMYLFGMDVPLEAVRAQIATSIDIIIHVARLRDGTRRIVSISEVILTADDHLVLNDLFLFEETGEQDGKIIGNLKRTKNAQVHTEKLYFAGLDDRKPFGDSV